MIGKRWLYESQLNNFSTDSSNLCRYLVDSIGYEIVQCLKVTDIVFHQIEEQCVIACCCAVMQSELPDDNSEREPPDSISNSEVKPLSADGSVGSPHVRVGHCQASKQNPG